MKAYLEQFNRYWDGLKPLERRWMVFIGSVMFIMVNYFFVWPHFNDYSKNKLRLQTLAVTNSFFQTEVNRKASYESKLKALQTDDSTVAEEDQAIDFVHYYSSRAAANKIIVTSQGQLATKTNDFSIDQQMGISIQADETNLVKFLYSLGSGSSAMRVRSMSMHPDPSHLQISAAITLVASYQKKAAARANGAAAGSSPSRISAPATAAKPTEPKPAAAAAAPGANTTNKPAGALIRHTATNKPAGKP